MSVGSFALPYDALDVVLRLLAATLIGVGLGWERLLRGKPTGIRTLGLVSFAAALVTLSVMHAREIAGNPDGLGRVLQGVVQVFWSVSVFWAAVSCCAIRRSTGSTTSPRRRKCGR